MLTISLQFQHSDSKIMNNERERERGGVTVLCHSGLTLLKIITPYGEGGSFPDQAEHGALELSRFSRVK